MDDRENAQRSPDGLWNALGDAEKQARLLLAKQLGSFEDPFRLAYEAGVQVPTLQAARQHTSDLLYASLFLKKTLNDLRGVWHMLRAGYTSQAAAIGASLWEDGLVAACLAGNEEMARELSAQAGADIPWRPVQLAKRMADKFRRNAQSTGDDFTDNDFELRWREVYSGYKWLCKIKHPTTPSAAHDSGATAHNANEYVVMAFPDIRLTDLSVKGSIAVIVLSRTLNTVEVISHEMQCDKSSTAYREFVAHVLESKRRAEAAYQEVSCIPLPFDLKNSALEKNYYRLKKEKG